MKIVEIDRGFKFKPFAIEFDDKPEIYILIDNLKSLYKSNLDSVNGCELVVEGNPSTTLLRLLESRLKNREEIL